MKFVALDVETANPDMSSICQIGIVHFEDGKVVDSWATLINPEDYFDFMNISIHGIEEHHVEHSPKFSAVAAEINRRLSGQIVAIHTAFDRNSIAQASVKNSVSPPDCTWLNTASVARRAWQEVSQRGYGLAALSKKFGIQFEHHNAVEDARACGLILVRAIADTNLGLLEWLDRVNLRLNTDANPSMARVGATDGPLHGEVAVFTGTLAIPRRAAVDMAAKAGCTTADGVTKHTTLLIVGDQDIKALHGKDKSSKHLKAEALIGKGQPIRILTESDFAAMVRNDG